MVLLIIIQKYYDNNFVNQKSSNLHQIRRLNNLANSQSWHCLNYLKFGIVMENNIMALVGAFVGIAILLGISVQILGNTVSDCSTLPGSVSYTHLRAHET